MRKWRIITGIVMAISLAAGLLLDGGRKVDETPYLKYIAPGVEFSVKSGNPPRYVATGGVVAFNSYDILPAIRGYAGPIKVLVALDGEGVITGLRIIDHRETQNYVHHMLSPEYLSAYIGKRVTDPFVIDRDIDAISRATVSVRALADTVRDSSLIVMGQGASQSQSRIRLSPKGIVFLALFIVALTVYAVSRRVKVRNLSLMRDGVLISSIALTGVWISSPLSIMQVFNLLLYGPSRELLWLSVVFGGIASMLIAGRFYCGWLCPFGALSEFVGRLGGCKWDLPRGVDARWRGLKYALLLIVAIVVLISRRTEFAAFEPYVTLFSMSGSILAWALVVVSLLACLKVPRFWCRFLCPVAALGGLLARGAEGYPSMKSCPMANGPSPAMSECIRCNKCRRTGRENENSAYVGKVVVKEDKID